MIVLGISGSPRRGGNAELLLDKFLEGARSKGASVEKIVLNELAIKGCQDCGGCDKNGICVLKDDMRAVYRKVEEADVIVISSPIFFGSVTAQLKAMVDRFQPLWVRKNILKNLNPSKDKFGAFLCVSGSDKKEFFKNAKTVIKSLFNTIGVTYVGGIYCGGVEEKGAIIKKEEVLSKAFEFGAKITSHPILPAQKGAKSPKN